MAGAHTRKKDMPLGKRRIFLLGALLVAALAAVVLFLVFFLKPGADGDLAATSVESLSSVASAPASSSSPEETTAPVTTEPPATSEPVTSAPPVTSKAKPVTSAPPASEEPAAGIDSIPYDPGDWALRLVNFETPLDGEFDPGLTKIKSKYNPNGLKFDSRAVEAVNIMCDAARADGVTLTVISAYRTISKQNSLYNNKVDRLVNAGYDREEALVEAATAVARPGTSEHHLGLAVDFNSVEQDFENTKAGKWLRQHAAEYGFIMRYPSGKKDITGVIYEPWHFRFVGRKHAAAIEEMGVCLEEYLDYLGK